MMRAPWLLLTRALIRAPVLALALALILTTLAGPARSKSKAAVTYVTSSTIYLDSGTRQGLRKGASVTIHRDGAEIGTLIVTHASSSRSACEAPIGLEFRVGDTAVFTESEQPAAFHDKASAPTSGSPSASSRSAAAWLHDQGWRGRFGLRFLGLADPSSDARYWEPGLDVRANGTSIGHPNLDMEVDIRARRTYRRSASGNSEDRDRSRVYRLSATWQRPQSPWRLSAGRQFGRALSAVTLFDGASLVRTGSRWTGGAFAGTQPASDTYGWSSDVYQHGVHVSLHDHSGTSRRWSAGLAFVGSYEEGNVNREHLAAQGRWSNGGVSANLLQEIDLNRDWRADDESTLSLTSSLASARWALHSDLSVSGGFDTRRRVRLYRDHVTPETEFDDSYRQGYWGGATWRPRRSTRLGIRARQSTGGAAGSATSVTGTARTAWPAYHSASLGLRTTRYENDRTEGWLHSLTVGGRWGNTNLDVTAGRRSDHDTIGSRADNHLTWGALDLDTQITRAWYGLLSVERSSADREENLQLNASALYRF